MHRERMNLLLKGGLAGIIFSFILFFSGFFILAASQGGCASPNHYVGSGWSCISFLIVVMVWLYLIWVLIPSFIIGAILSWYFGKWWAHKFSMLRNKIKLLFKWLFQVRWRWILTIALLDFLLIFFRGDVLGDCQRGCPWYDELTRWVIFLLSLYVFLIPLVRLVLLLFKKGTNRK